MQYFLFRRQAGGVTRQSRVITPESNQIASQLRKSTPRDASLDAAGFVFAFQKVHQGNRRLKTPEMPADADLDLCASATPDGGVYVTAINRSTNREYALELSLCNFAGSVQSAMKLLVPRMLDMKELAFVEREERLTMVDGKKVELKVPPCGITRVSFVTPNDGNQEPRSRQRNTY